MVNGSKSEKKNAKRKLSESRNVNLPLIHLPSLKKSSSDSPSGKKHNARQKQDEDGSLAKSKPLRKTQTIASSPVGYTLSHLLDVDRNGLLSDASQQLTPVSTRLDDSLDVTIYWADERGFKFSLVGGKLATASSLLLLLSDHLGIDAEIFKEVCALWMISNLLEVQLKPHHNPYEIRKNWKQFLTRFTSATDDEAVADEPLLMLKRNVQLSMEQEFQLEEQYTNEILTEILYTSAKQEVLNGRYICDIKLSLKLAALQMAIETEPNEDMDIFRDEVVMFFPLKHRHNVKTLHLFGIPIIGCKGLEMRIFEEYRNIKSIFVNKHACRKAYLNYVRSTPFYGAAFFHGSVERPSGGGSLKEIKKMILSVTLPDIPVLVGINREFITLIDEAKQELLLVQQLSNCDWRCIDSNLDGGTPSAVASDYSCFLLSFPDGLSPRDHSPNAETEPLKNPEKTKLLQIFSKQSVMMEALLNSILKLLELKIDDTNTDSKSDEQEAEITETPCPEIEVMTSDDSSPDQENTFVTSIAVELGNEATGNGYTVLYHGDGLKYMSTEHCSSLPNTPNKDIRTRGNADFRSVINTGCLPYPFISSFDKLCLATLDENGQCLEAQGSLRRVLQEVV